MIIARKRSWEFKGKAQETKIKQDEGDERQKK